MKRLVVCADGTWNSPKAGASDGGGSTNVAKIAALVAVQDVNGLAQEVFYHPGAARAPAWNRVLGGTFGVGLSRQVMACYAWLVDRYRPADQLYLFGFSRGAYTARTLIGFIRNCGVLRPEHRDRIGEAYRFYRDRSPQKQPRSSLAVRFRQEHAHPGQVAIKFVGVWDTVGSLGIPMTGPIGWLMRRRLGFHDAKLSSWVENAFHALAIDERRKPFAPALWEVSDADRSKPTFRQRIEQVWFPGAHADVGGGYADSRLSDITLAWMLARATECGLAVEASGTKGLRGDVCGPIYNSMTWYYRVFGALTRRIDYMRADAAGNPLHTFESVNVSALDRRRRCLPKYDPENLRGFAG